MDGELHLRLKTRQERKNDIERQMEFLDHQALAAKRDYDRRIAEIETKRALLRKAMRRLAKEEKKR